MVHPSTSHFSNADVALVYGEPKPRETVWVSLATSRRFARLWRICFLRWWRRLIYSSLHIQLMLCGSAILAICLTVMHFLPRSSFALLDIFLVDLSSTWQTCLRLCECSVWEPCVNSVCCVSVCVYVSVCDNVVCDATVCVCGSEHERYCQPHPTPLHPTPWWVCSATVCAREHERLCHPTPWRVHASDSGRARKWVAPVL